jgi:hypothetical protein
MNKQCFLLAALLVTIVVIALVIVGASWFRPEEEIQSGAQFSVQEQEKLSLAVIAFEQSDGQEIDSFVELAKVLSTEKIVEVCKGNYFTGNQAVCLRAMALGKEMPEEIAAICNQINSDFCSSLYTTDEQITACQQNAVEHKKECPLKLPIWR